MNIERKNFHVLGFLIILFLVIIFLIFVRANFFNIRESIMYEKDIELSAREEKKGEVRDIVNYSDQEERYGVLLAGYEGFYVFDKLTGEIITAINYGKYVNDGQLYGDFFYVVDREGLKIFDFSEPTKPSLLNSYNTFGDSLSVATNGDMIFVGDGENGLVSFELRDNIYIRLKEHIRLPGIVAGVDIYNNYLIACGPGLGLKIFLIEEDQTLKEINDYEKLLSPKMMTFNDNYLIINDDLYGILVFDMEEVIKPFNKNLNPSNILDIRSFSIYLEDTYLLFSTENGVSKINLNSLEIENILNKNLSLSNITIDEELLYISNNQNGLYIYDLKDKKQVQHINLVNNINNFVILEEGVLIDEGGKIIFIDNNKDKIWEKEYIGQLVKGKEGFYEIQDTRVIFHTLNEETKKVFPATIENIKETSESVFVIGIDGIYSFEEETKIVEGSFTDITSLKNFVYITQPDKIIQVNLLSKEMSYKFYSKDLINNIYYVDNDFFLLTDKGILRLDYNFDQFDYYGYQYVPDNIIITEEYIFYSYGSKLNIIKSKNFNVYKTIDLELPILGLEYKNNNLYISFSSKGIVKYNILENLQLEQLENTLPLFNAKKLVL